MVFLKGNDNRGCPSTFHFSSEFSNVEFFHSSKVYRMLIVNTFKLKRKKITKIELQTLKVRVLEASLGTTNGRLWVGQ